MDDFYIGQTFAGVYPPAAAGWCNNHNAHLERVGNRVTIVANQLPGTEELLVAYENAVQAYLDATAQSRAFNAWRDQVWRRCHEILNAVEAGECAPPSTEELLAMLPVIDWNDPT